MSIIKQIDESLNSYYNSFKNLKSINRYTNDDNIGKFILYCSENGIDDEDIESELEVGPSECSLIDFDLDQDDNHLFPFNKPIINKQKQNQEIYRIIRNMYIDAKSPQSQPAKSNYIFSGQQFVYTKNTANNDNNIEKRDDVSLLLFGYIHENENNLHLNEYVGGIPNVLIEIMIFFYGKKYFINLHSPPKHNEYDYAMEILSPIEQIGIYYKKSKITHLFTPQSRQNIIWGSNIIQINDTAITSDTNNEEIGKLMNCAKNITPSYVVFRCDTDHKKKGTHLQFDVSFDKQYIGHKFPYHKFTKTIVQSVFDQVFGADGDICIMEIYANKQTCNGTWGSYGVSLLLFMDNNDKLYKNYELFDAVPVIQALLQRKINENLVVRFTKKMEGIKANGIGCGWSRCKRSLYELCFLIQEDDTDRNEDIFYFVMVDIERMDLFHIEQTRDVFNITSQAHILHSCYDFPPGLQTQKKILSAYKFYCNTDDSL